MEKQFSFQEKQDQNLTERQKIQQEEQDKIEKQKLIDGQLSTKETTCYCAQLVITIILVVALFQDHRIQDGFEIIEGLDDFLGMTNLTDESLMSFKSLFDNKISGAINNIYNSKNKNLTLTYNPQQYNTLQNIYDAQPNYQENQDRIQFLTTFNLFLGMRIRIDLRSISDNDFVETFFEILSKDQIILIEPGGYQDQEAKIKIIFQTNSENLIKTDDYIDMFFTSELDIGVVRYLLDFLQIQLSDIKTYQITVDVFSVNLIRQMIVQQNRVFTETDQGALQYYQKDQVAIFLNIKGNTNPANTLYMSYLIKIFYLCCVSIQILISFLLKVLGMIANFITTKIFIFDKYLIINLILQSVVVVYLSSWLGLFSTYESLSQSTFQSFSDFDHYADYMSLYNGDRFFSIVVLTIQTIALVQLINQKIPSFNIIYYSLTNSGRDLFLLMIFIVIMLVAFSVVGTIIFSATYIRYYSDIGGTLFELFKFIFQYGVLAELVRISTGTGIVFGLIFILFFNFILIPYLYSVIIVNYNSIREAMSITTEAITSIESEKQFKFLKKIFNLVTFASPQQVLQQKQEQEEKKKLKQERDKQSIENMSVHDKSSPDKRIKGGFQSHIDQNISYSVNSPRKNRGNDTPIITTPEKRKAGFYKSGSIRGSQEDLSVSRKNSRSFTLNPSAKKKSDSSGNGLENDQVQQGPEAKMNWQQKLQYNFKQLGFNFYGFYPAKVEVQTRQQRQDEIVQRIEELKFEKKKEKVAIQKKRAKTARDNIQLTIIHIYFLIVLIFMGSQQILYDQCYNINKAIDNYYRNTEIVVLQGLVQQKITFDTVSEISHLYAWIEKVFLPPLTPQFTTNSYSDRIDQYNLIFAEFPARMTIRRAKVHQNTDFQFYNITSDKMQDLPLYIQTAGDMSPKDSYSDEYKQDFYGPLTLKEYYYIPSGAQTTPYEKGGFVQYFTTKETQNNLYLLNIYKDQIINHDTGTIVLECIFYNKFYDLYSYAVINFDITTSGYISKKINISTFIIDLYSNDRLSRIAWEILFFIQILIYFRQFKNKFTDVFMSEEMESLTPFNKELEQNYILYMLNYKIEEGEYSLVGLVKQILTRTLEFMHRLLMSLKIYCQQTTANIFLIVGQILALIIIIFYLTYVCDSDRIDFNRNSSAGSYKLIGQFSDFASQIGKYSDVMSILMFVQFMRILFYFGFSGKLALVLDVIANANLDVFFFLIIFFILLSAFGLVSIVLFGSDISQFQDFPNCLIELISWLSGVQTFPTENSSATTTEYIFYILFLIIMQLILMRMFIAILDGYFIQKINDKEDQTKGIIDLVIDILHSYKKQADSQSKEQVEEEQVDEESQKKANKGLKFIKKMKDCIWRYLNKALAFFLKIYFRDDDANQKKNEKQPQFEEALKLHINFKENDENSVNTSQQTINERQLDLLTYWNNKNNEQDTNKEILDKKDKSSINFWMMLLSESLQATTNKQLTFSDYDKKGNILYLNEYRQIEYKMENYQNGIRTLIQLPEDVEQEKQSPRKNGHVEVETKFQNKPSRQPTNKNEFRKSVLYLEENEQPLIKYGRVQMKKEIEEMKKRQRNVHIEYNQEWKNLFDGKIMTQIIDSLSDKIYLFDVKNKKQKLYKDQINELIESKKFKVLINSIFRTAEYIIHTKSKKKNEYKLISHLFYCLLYFFYNLVCVDISENQNQQNSIINKITDFDYFDNDKEIQDAQLNLSARDISVYLENLDFNKDDDYSSNNYLSPQKEKSEDQLNIKVEENKISLNRSNTIYQASLKKRGGKIGDFIITSNQEKKTGLPQRIHKVLSEIELLQVFKRCFQLQQLWKQTSLHDKIHLWFGSDFINPYLQHYLKQVLWHNSYFQKETFQPFQKKYQIDLNQFFQNQEVQREELQNLWEFFYNYSPSEQNQSQENKNIQERNSVIRNKMNKKENGEIELENLQNQNQNVYQPSSASQKGKNKIEKNPIMELKKKHQMEENGDLNTFQINEIKDIHLQFIQMAVRDETDRVGILYSKDTQSQKYNFLKNNKRVKNDHKMIIFHLMTIEEKMRLTFLNEDDVVSKIEFLMIIEESYESVMNIIKLDKDLNDEMRQWIFDFYYNFAQFNSYSTAYKVKKQFQAYTEKSEDVYQYIKDLERTILRLDQLIEDNIKILKQYV